MGMLNRKADVLIVGGGLAGLQAAVTISEVAPQATVLICDLGGGASTEIMGFCTPVHENDSVDCFTADILKSGGGENNPQLARILAEGASRAVHELEKNGVPFDRESDGHYSLVHSVGSTYPRVVHYKTLTGKTAVAKYTGMLRDKSNVLFRKSRIVKLLKSDGRVCGALGFCGGEPEAYSAKAVILCTGGGAGLFGFSSWTKALRGSGYALAHDAGAQLTGMHNIQYEPCVTIHPEKLRGFPVITTVLFEGARLIDAAGNDLLAGRTPPPKRELAKIVTEAIRAGNHDKHGGVWFDFSGMDEKRFMEKYPEYYHKLRPFAERYSSLRLEVKPAAHTTLGGVVIDGKTHSTVSGLFVAGECAGGIHGRDRIGGNAGTEVFVFGCLAGQSAADYATRASFTDMSPQVEAAYACIHSGNACAEEYLAGIGSILDRYCLLDRDRDSLERGRAALELMQKKFAENPPATKEETCVCRMAFAVAGMYLE